METFIRRQSCLALSPSLTKPVMSFLEQLRAKRQPLATVLVDNEYSGIRRLLEELYPDRAHFIYELLQNAEDADATEAEFVLREDSLSLEHNGRSFTDADVDAITNIGKGTKAENEDKIGRFGAGFKAVFAYSETPHIWSPTHSFCISSLVLPSALARDQSLGAKTRFEFPFNNPKKSQDKAFSEVEAGLQELADQTLLFLTHLERISWKILGEDVCEFVRIQHSKFHVEIIKRSSGKTLSRSHFLRFSEPITGLASQCVSIAYVLDWLPEVIEFDHDLPLAKQFRIVPALPGRVSVFFPAEKESSGLRFHLHAPFVPELSRASIKETPANDPLYDQLKELAAKSLYQVRDLKLLTTDFLGVLPNTHDSLGARYAPIRKAIIQEMREQALTPTHARSHAPASSLRQAKASLKDLITGGDLKFLIAPESGTLQWAVGATQKNSDVDRFLTDLGIREWDTQQFATLLHSKLTPSRWSPEPDAGLMTWLKGKSIEWHQQMYALFFRELKGRRELGALKDATIIRLGTGEYSNGSCFFPDDRIEHDEVLPRVDRRVYSSGKSKMQQEEARRFLDEVGVREVGEREQIEATLKTRYTSEAEIPNNKTYFSDLSRFIALVEKEPDCNELFQEYYIFKSAPETWHTPNEIYLDAPFLETDLHEYYPLVETGEERMPLSLEYEESGISLNEIGEFAKSVGAHHQLEIVQTSCKENPEWDHLRSVRGSQYNHPIDKDWIIPGLHKIIESQSITLSRLIWCRLCADGLVHSHSYWNRPKLEWLKATYQKNNANGSHTADSQLIHLLRTSKWVPQDEDKFVTPDEADPRFLPDGFLFDPGNVFLEAVWFGNETKQQWEAYRRKGEVARQAGFQDAETLERAQKFAQLPADEQVLMIEEAERRRAVELPEHEPANPSRRAIQVKLQAEAAPEKSSERRERSVSISQELVKAEASEYLLEQYTNADGELICQICKAPMPFKLADGTYYFERVELLKKFRQHHRQNHLALCPNHSAMFQHANGSADDLERLILAMNGPRLAITLAQQDVSIYFTKTHLADIQALIDREHECSVGETDASTREA